MSGTSDAGGGGDSGGVRERILNAAMAILQEHGIQQLSQVQVARRAQVRQSHLTYYFPRRHDLTEAIATRFIDGVIAGIEAMAAEESADPAAVLGRVAQAVVDPGHMRMFAGVIVEADSDPALRAVVVRQTLRLQSTLASLLPGDDAAERAALLVASLWGLGLHTLLIQSPSAPAVAATVRAALHGDGIPGPGEP